MTLGIEREGLAEPLRELARAGTPVLGTCAGLIMLDRDHLGLMDIVRRAQRLRPPAALLRGGPEFPDIDGEPVRAVFIRAPWIAEAGADVEVLAASTGTRSRRARATCSRCRSTPSSASDDRLHRAFLEQIRSR